MPFTFYRFEQGSVREILRHLMEEPGVEARIPYLKSFSGQLNQMGVSQQSQQRGGRHLCLLALHPKLRLAVVFKRLGLVFPSPMPSVSNVLPTWLSALSVEGLGDACFSVSDPLLLYTVCPTSTFSLP